MDLKAAEKTTDFIDALKAAIDADDISAVHTLAVNTPKNYMPLMPIDWMALGWTMNTYSQYYEARDYLETIITMGFGPKLSPENRYAYHVGSIAARIKRDDLTDTSLTEKGRHKIVDLTAQFLGTVYPISTFHPDADVQHMAAWATHQLKERKGKQMGLIPA